jgi:microcystin degradation protein MlrC
MKIFVAGFHHETNTFAPSPADWDAFNAGAGYPAYVRGPAMLERMQGMSLAIGGFAESARAQGWTLLPSVWAGAMPSNRITADAFERLAGEITDDLRAALRVGADAVYLDLHGAAMAEGFADAEGELLERLRALADADLPIVASLDLHANVTARMLRHASAMTAYRTYPHVDMRAGGDSNTTGLLHALLRGGAGRRLPGKVALGLLFDRAAAQAAHAAGIGARAVMQVGAAVRTFDGRLSDPPVAGEFTVRALHDGTVVLSGPMAAGATARLGPCARVEIEGVQLLLASAKAQMLDLDLMRFLGVEPAAMRVLVVKSSVHFRAAFAPISSNILVARAAGPMAADPGELPWRQLPRGMASRP